MTPIVECDNLGKRYQLRHQSQTQPYVALRDVIADTLAAPFRKAARASAEREEFWALRGVSFDIGAGDVVGIIGRNGAGKSTLLKVLSRITEPTEGRLVLHGRVASLLEVGTGFHPELTGRENIFLNGAILGMSRTEIVRKFDDIVAFAEIERFLDTPVKRYSSGMYVRLAFAVAAHLEPEILIVDEVLAVGDAEFQKKCLGKMHEVSRGGRTVLFVSHNMAAINALTQRTLVLNAGQVVFDGATPDAIRHYSQLVIRSETASATGRGVHTAIVSVAVIDAEGSPIQHHVPGSPLRLSVVVDTDGAPRLSVDMFLVDAMRQKLAMASLYQFEHVTLPQQPGRYRVMLEVRPGWLASGTYTFDVTTSVVNSNWDHYVEDAASIEVVSSNPGSGSWDFRQDYGYGAFALPSIGPPDISRLPVESGAGVEATAIMAAAATDVPVASTDSSLSVARCPACGGTDITQVGEPASGFDTVFAGAHFFQPPYAVGVCSQCGLYFKTVTLTAVALAAYYVALDGAVFDVEADFPTDRVLHQRLAGLSAGSRVLDFGCSTGRILKNLTQRLACFGVEPNEPSAALARSRGIDIIAAEHLDEQAPFDAILLTDVYEHLTEPLPLLQRLASKLAPGGWLGIVTGNADAVSHRRLAEFWYFRLPGHVIMLGERHLRWLAAQTGLTLEAAIRCSHYSVPLRERMRQRVQAFAYDTFRDAPSGATAGVLRLVPRISGATRWKNAPALTYRDDQIVAFLVRPNA
jgi:lipopolysaccharide transport system ATP-binding protein